MTTCWEHLSWSQATLYALLVLLGCTAVWASGYLVGYNVRKRREMVRMYGGRRRVR